MNDQLNLDDQRSHSPASPGVASNNNGASLNTDNFDHSAPANNSGASDGVALETPGDARADEAKQTHSQQPDDVWPAPGDAVLTTNEARLYLFKHHDIFLKERRVQKMVSDTHELVGRRMPKGGRGHRTTNQPSIA